VRGCSPLGDIVERLSPLYLLVKWSVRSVRSPDLGGGRGADFGHAAFW
jgi:hypothetical protein